MSSSEAPIGNDLLSSSKGRIVYYAMRERIEQGAFAPGTRLPGEPSLAAEFGVSRHVVQSALELLAQQGVVERRKGSGTYVRERNLARRVTMDLESVWSQILEMARATEVRLLALNYEVPAAHIAQALRLKRGERVQTTVRVRSTRGQPFSHVVTRVPERVASQIPEAELSTTPMLDLFDRAGIVPRRATQSISATTAGPILAGHLNVEVGAALLTLTRVTFDADERGIQYLDAHYRPDLYNFQMDLVRGAGAGPVVWDVARKMDEPVSA